MGIAQQLAYAQGLFGAGQLVGKRQAHVRHGKGDAHRRRHALHLFGDRPLAQHVTLVIFGRALGGAVGGAVLHGGDRHVDGQHALAGQEVLAQVAREHLRLWRGLTVARADRDAQATGQGRAQCVDLHLALAEGGVVAHHVGDAPAVGRHLTKARFAGFVVVAVLLLHVLRGDEHPLRPSDASAKRIHFTASVTNASDELRAT